MMPSARRPRSHRSEFGPDSPILKQPVAAGLTNVGLMKALVYHGPGQKAWEDVPDATISEPTDVVVKIDTTTICGTDLHILHGDVPAVTDGRILGHEAVGTVTEVGDAVKGFSVGDRVLVPAITKCGRCEYCQRNMPSHCQTVGSESACSPGRSAPATPSPWSARARWACPRS